MGKQTDVYNCNRKVFSNESEQTHIAHAETQVNLKLFLVKKNHIIRIHKRINALCFYFHGSINTKLQ